MGKILLFASFVFVVASGVLGFLNKTKLDATRESLASVEEKSSQTQQALTSTKKELNDANTNLATVKAERDQATSQVTSLQSDVEKAKSEVASLTTQKTAAESQVTQLQADVQSKQQELENLRNAQQTPATQGPSQEQLAIQKEQETLIAQLQQKVDNQTSELSKYRQADEDRKQGLMRPGTEGKILAVNPAWNFVVLSLGDKNGVVNNAELLIKRGRQLIGKVRVTSVEPSTSIADIVSNSVPQGVVINPGDRVIYQSAE
ncbi:hypothetical protein TSACC_22529 [Terrimicrobium sacchariphilum]|uniref:Chromosome partition protein Smc n=1 Tax=Terrimicrobium sacchariphilum TaxID=690879 RepID=A0A146G8T3_TERSA|nr:hypothetical protein [Terrimicrobium sacchariphilum]GAT34105.1 hypothetical protein TSACC_22529 [Terrimicrobium sacchariphilum]